MIDETKNQEEETPEAGSEETPKETGGGEDLNPESEATPETKEEETPEGGEEAGDEDKGEGESDGSEPEAKKKEWIGGHTMDGE